MKENYYEILQINKNASPEIVEKAYKTLVRMYHPDLQENENKQDYEEKLKLINEAYETLSNEDKRKQYDIELEQEELLNERKNNINQDNLYSSLDNDKSINYNNEQIYQNINEKIEQAKKQAELERQYNDQINAAVEKAYHDAYIQDLKNRGYKIKYKKTFKDYVKNTIALIITIFILFLLFQIPFVKNYITSLYYKNEILHYIVDLFLNILNK